MTDKEYMKLAIRLAKQGSGRVSPNPLVGAVVVKDGVIIGKGYHEEYGQLHAERNALADCKVSPEGATMYVTLEPCCHYGKTPPCTKAIMESGIKRVVIGSLDPNPIVAGNGIKELREAGIEVVYGVLEKECNKLNAVFFHYIRKKTPYVVLKYAMTIDGKIATYTGASKWITGEQARENVHKDRNRYKAIMVGVETVRMDDPMLTCRVENGVNPIRIICDSTLRIPFDSQIVQTAADIPTIIATACKDEQKQKPYTEAGCEIIVVGVEDGKVNLEELMRELGERRIDSILLEGGSKLHWSALRSGIVNRVQCYIAPKIFGGECAKTPIAGEGVSLPEQAVRLKNMEIKQLGEDYLIEGEVEKNCLQEL
ncbi:bifunctional diaminohydroxyphosphoribosylaminopyrimidine deaminase/5-amino-6-(5-phosphoribosylamino)uracil reductase RibD [Anaerosporobacter sp.]|uniref:bifunctional diaminohydroxyphosphoribosylaminopyrimidine deaminase/5-amino-6-(5-phosphoribosylamino)uracil reductase RibD n=1 Tax=Anaerosporobacter sp. TaxID=1872529 RepID=UPI00286F879A|nr:bifunctional diaminohydroxyphosphoribosylaminopyrimidine deaminase/5-amino-6-(5-phosphoribosylamino)uracil reductase RibD [Anaerosporobacter sp.]